MARKWLLAALAAVVAAALLLVVLSGDDGPCVAIGGTEQLCGDDARRACRLFLVDHPNIKAQELQDAIAREDCLGLLDPDDPLDRLVLPSPTPG